jgi:hypothetical protein
LITKDKPPFEKDQAILVIDSGTLHREAFAWHMSQVDFDTHLVDGPNNTAVALCTRTGGQGYVGGDGRGGRRRGRY